MKNGKMLSIIVPVYNAEKYLKRCIDSILGQCYKNCEIILVDDGSTDGSWRIIDTYLNKFPHVVAIKKENGGANSARKEGLEIASGEYIMFVDADDYICSSTGKKLVDIMEKEHVDIVLCKIAKVFEGEIVGVIGRLPRGKYSGYYIAENMINTKDFFMVNMALGLCANLYKRKYIKSVFENIDLRITFSEDVACSMLILLDSAYVYVLDECLYYYRQNSNSITHRHRKSNISSEKYLYNYMIKEFRKRNISSIIYKEIEWLIIENLLIGGYEIFKNKNYLYPFSKVKRGSNIVVYGAGIFGGELLKTINKFQICRVVLWVDSNWKNYQTEIYTISDTEEIEKVEYDYIVIAVLNPRVIDEIYQELKRKRIDLSKVVSIDQELISYKELPEIFWTECN